MTAPDRIAKAEPKFLDQDLALCVSTDDIYITAATEPYGTAIYIDRKTGIVSTVESGTILHPDDEEKLLYYGDATGDFSDDDWGVVEDWEDGGHFVQDPFDGRTDGPFDDRDDALRAAVRRHGIHANDHDEIIARVRDAQKGEEDE